MSANRPDISYIRKYLNGELDARAMYQLERQAQDDPFLMDMIKGVENGDDTNHQDNLNAIDELIKQRIEQEDKRVVPLYRYWPAAACLVIALGIGGWWLTRPIPKPLVANNIIQPKAVDKMKDVPQQAVKRSAAPIAQSDIVTTIFPPSVVKQAAPAAMQPPPVIANDVRIDTNADKIAYNKPNALKEVTAIGYGAQKRTSVAASVATVTPVDALKKSADAATSNMVTGKVVDERGQPLPGVMVKAKNNPTVATTTDAEGNYSLKLSNSNPVIDFSFIGYEKKELLAKNNTIANIALSPTHSGLDEVVVTAYGTQKRTNITGQAKAKMKAENTVSPDSTSSLAEVVVAEPVKEPQPIMGRKSYDTYIDEHAVMPDGATGKVKLAFTVNHDGSLTDIRIINGSNKAMNDKAIEIIKNGPKWIGGPKPKEIRLKISFHK